MWGEASIFCFNITHLLTHKLLSYFPDLDPNVIRSVAYRVGIPMHEEQLFPVYVISADIIIKIEMDVFKILPRNLMLKFKKDTEDIVIVFYIIIKQRSLIVACTITFFFSFLVAFFRAVFCIATAGIWNWAVTPISGT